MSPNDAYLHLLLTLDQIPATIRAINQVEAIHAAIIVGHDQHVIHSSICAPGRCAVDCTSRQPNAHVTESRVVPYRWHPWHGRAVFAFRAVTKGEEAVFRCTRGHGITTDLRYHEEQASSIYQYTARWGSMKTGCRSGCTA